MIIHTPCLTLRPVAITDAPFILGASTGTVRRYFVPFDTEAEVVSWTQENIDRMSRARKLELVCLDKSSQTPVGMVALDTLQDRLHLTPRLWIAPEYQRQGYAREALTALLDAVQSQPAHRHKSVVYEVDTDNHASMQLAKSLGFTRTGEGRDEAGLYHIYTYTPNPSP